MTRVARSIGLTTTPQASTSQAGSNIKAGPINNGFAAKVVFCRRPRSGLNKNSPALQRWGPIRFDEESVKRTTESYGFARFRLSRPLHGLNESMQKPCSH